MVSIMSLCTKLEELDINNNKKMSMKQLQVRLLSSSAENRLPLLKKLIVGYDEFENFMKFVKDPINAVDQKWVKILKRFY